MNKIPKILIEDCFALSTSDINRNFNRPGRKIGSPIESRRTDINYWFDNTDNVTVFYVSVGGNEPQKILYENLETSITGQWYFHCGGCEARVSRLYLLPGGREFKCRNCYKLRYLLTTLSRTSPQGKARYQFARMAKLSEYRTQISTPIYDGRFSHKFERFLRMCSRAGLVDVVNNAKALMENLKSFQ